MQQVAELFGLTLPLEVEDANENEEIEKIPRASRGAIIMQVTQTGLKRENKCCERGEHH